MGETDQVQIDLTEKRMKRVNILAVCSLMPQRPLQSLYPVDPGTNNDHHYTRRETR